MILEKKMYDQEVSLDILKWVPYYQVTPLYSIDLKLLCYDNNLGGGMKNKNFKYNPSSLVIQNPDVFATII